MFRFRIVSPQHDREIIADYMKTYDAAPYIDFMVRVDGKEEFVARYIEESGALIERLSKA